MGLIIEFAKTRPDVLVPERANPSDAGLLLMRSDAYSGIIDRTFVVAAVDGEDTIAYSFNGRVGEFKIDAQPGAEAKCMFTVHPRGNQYGWSNNT